MPSVLWPLSVNLIALVLSLVTQQWWLVPINLVSIALLISIG